MLFDHWRLSHAPLFFSFGFLVAFASGNASGQSFSVERDSNGSIISLDFFGDAQQFEDLEIDGNRLAQLSQLRSIFLNSHDITHKELAYLATLKSVTSVRIGDLADEVELSAEELQELRTMHWLTDLSITEINLQPSTWSFLNGLGNLRHLAIGPDFDEQGTKCLANLNKLESLELVGEFSVATAQTISNLPAL